MQYCKQCSRGSLNGNNFCITCDKNTSFKYLLKINNISNCVEKCPNNTILNETLNQCIEIEIKKNETNDNKEGKSYIEIILIS